MKKEQQATEVGLRELQLLELELFKAFKDYCDRNDLTYFALGGTLLGAVRHKGFIPWDDDMDLGMPREDYEVFLRTFSDQNDQVSLHWHGNDPDHSRYFARLEDPRAKVLRRDMVPPELTSAWIDIFPLDGMPSGRFALAYKKAKIMARRATFRFSQSSHTVITANRPWYERAAIILQTKLPINKIFSFDREWLALDRLLRADSYAESSIVINAMGHWKFREMFPKSCYGEGKMYEFEDTQVRGPVDYDAVCSSLYGDYMTPVNTAHHGTSLKNEAGNDRTVS